MDGTEKTLMALLGGALALAVVQVILSGVRLYLVLTDYFS